MAIQWRFPGTMDCFNSHFSMDWFQGKKYRKHPYFIGKPWKIYGFL